MEHEKIEKQLLFSFDQDMRVEKTLIQTLASRLSCNSCSRLKRTLELKKVLYKLSLLNSHGNSYEKFRSYN